MTIKDTRKNRDHARKLYHDDEKHRGNEDSEKVKHNNTRRNIDKVRDENGFLLVHYDGLEEDMQEGDEAAVYESTNGNHTESGYNNFLEVDYCTSVDEEESSHQGQVLSGPNSDTTNSSTIEQVDGTTVLSEDDRELIQNYIESIGIHDTDIHNLPEDKLLGILSDRNIKYMSAKEKHNIRKVRQIIRNILVDAIKRQLMDESNMDEDEALQAAIDRISSHGASHATADTATTTATANENEDSNQPSANNVLHTIYSRLLRTVENDDLTTAKMSKVIGNLEYFGLDDMYFILPRNKRSAPTPVRSPFYFYQCDYRRMYPQNKMTKKILETNWKELDHEKKEYFVRLYELDKIRYKFQMLQYHRLQDSK